jgi:hypothetical protein
MFNELQQVLCGMFATQGACPLSPAPHTPAPECVLTCLFCPPDYSPDCKVHLFPDVFDAQTAELTMIAASFHPFLCRCGVLSGTACS